MPPLRVNSGTDKQKDRSDEVGFHVLDEGAGDGRREIERLSNHALSSSTKPGGIFGGLSSSLAS
jgi:hypothetical protein